MRYVWLTMLLAILFVPGVSLSEPSTQTIGRSHTRSFPEAEAKKKGRSKTLPFPKADFEKKARVSFLKIEAMLKDRKARKIDCPSGTTKVEVKPTKKQPYHSIFCQDNQGISQGPIIVWYKDSEQRFFEANHKNGKLNGPYRSWFSDGTLNTKGTLQKGRQHGLKTRWHPNGKKAEISRWKVGRLLSFKEWDERGKRLPTARFTFHRLSAKSIRLIRAAVSPALAGMVVGQVVKGARLSKIDIRWPRHGSTVKVIYHLPVRQKIATAFRGGGYLNKEILKKINDKLLPISEAIAYALGARAGIYGWGRDNPGLMARLRLVGRLASIEFKMHLNPNAAFITPSSFECYRRGKKTITVDFINPYVSDTLTIGPATDIGGKRTLAWYGHLLWK